MFKEQNKGALSILDITTLSTQRKVDGMLTIGL